MNLSFICALVFFELNFLRVWTGKVSPEEMLATKLHMCNTMSQSLPPLPPAPPITSVLVKKRTTSRSLRVLFIMGLEGTGHHMWTNLFNVCQRTVGPCTANKTLTELMYSGGPEPEGIFAYSSSETDSDELISCRQQLFVRMLISLKTSSAVNVVFLNVSLLIAHIIGTTLIRCTCR